eukprot:TRINITY_DN4405_c0_g1_i1.p1 TRINITY_DN4405_c0_g1~~TRINITY_DN4405_c0_g1_i1.p1  ORF type:complete len:789 (+),score=103.53 TRINITY_DN4405_c0_g1_i1:670-3036(+)
MKWKGAWPVAIVATIGNLLQGWDNATIAGAVLYIKKEFHLENSPTIEGLIVAMGLIGATAFTTVSGPMADWLGRRSMLIISASLYTLSSIVMFWSPNVYVLLLGRLLDGLGVGLSVTLVPAYISEIAPSDIRGQLNTLPQLLGSGGMFLSYCFVFGMSLLENPNWRLMLALLFFPSMGFVLLTVFYLPESPRWLVSKGRMREAKQVLQDLRGKEDVSGEMALLVEGLQVGGSASLEEFIIQPEEVDGSMLESVHENGSKLYGPGEGHSWIAKPVASEYGGLGQSFLSRHGSLQTQSIPLMDPVVTLFGSVHSATHDHWPDTGSMRSVVGGMLNVAEEQGYQAVDDEKNEQWDEEGGQRDPDEGYASEEAAGYLEENLQSPLLHRYTSAKWDHSGTAPADTFSNSLSNILYRSHSKSVRETPTHRRQGSSMSMPRHSSVTSAHLGSVAESFAAGTSTGIGGGWQLAWQWTGPEGKDPSKPEVGSYKRIFLRQEGGSQSRRASMMSLPSVHAPPEEPIQAAALVSQPSLFPKELLDEHPVGPAIVHPSETAVKGPKWTDLFEGGVKRALIVGVGIQLLQQFSGINGVLYYTPQILEEAGADVLFQNMGIGSDSASLLISAFTSLLMLPCIVVALKLMDESGRRSLLLMTIPVLVLSVILLVITSVLQMGEVLEATTSCIGVITYICCFVMGFGPVPNIICAEIFPTRVRGVCIAICAFTFWVGDIIVTYTVPSMIATVGISGLFSIFAVVCVIAWVFVFLKVPETKGMPLEVITEFFAMSAATAKQSTKA